MKRDVGVVLDGDLVVVVDAATRLPSCWWPASERRLAADALLDVAVGGEAPRSCGRRRLSPGGGVRVEQAALAAGGHGHADRVADALAERAGGGLDAGGVAVLGVARGQRAPGAQRLQVVQLQAVAGEVELDVEGQAGVAQRTARTGPGRASSGRPGRAAATSGTAGRPPAPGSSRCRGGRCRPSARRPWPARGRCRRPGGRGRRTRPAGSLRLRSDRPVGCRWRPRRGASDRGALRSHAGRARLRGRCPCDSACPRGAAADHPVPARMRWRDRPRLRRPTRCGRSTNAINPSRRARGDAASRRRCPADRLRVPAYGSMAPFASCSRALRARGRPVTALSERRGRSGRAGPAARAVRCGAYVALTKPRIIELLLVTTVPAMMLAARGLPSLVAAGRHAGRRHPRRPGAANAFNCYIDRDIDQLMRRTRAPAAAGGAGHRRAARWSSAWCWRSLSMVLLAAFTTLLAAALAAGAILYYALVYTLVLKRAHPAEHRVGRRRRGGAGADRLGRGHRLAGLAAGGALRRRLLLAAAALLGAGHAVQGRLRRGPACRCCRWWPPALSVGRQTVVWTWLTVAVLAAAVAGGAGSASAGSTPPSAAALGGWFVARGAPPARPHPPRRATPADAAVPHLDHVHGAARRSRSSSTSSC